MKGYCVWLGSALAALGLAAPVVPHMSAAPAPASKNGSILVLDNCDPDFKGKAAYEQDD